MPVWPRPSHPAREEVGACKESPRGSRPAALPRPPSRSLVHHGRDLQAPGEAERVDEQTQQRYPDEARRRFAENRAAELSTREARSRSVRLRNAQNEARRLSVDVAHELRAIDVQIDLFERKAANRRATLSTAP
jgi:hypothetical protein